MFKGARRGSTGKIFEAKADGRLYNSIEEGEKICRPAQSLDVFLELAAFITSFKRMNLI